MTWFTPATLDEALPILAGGARVIAGGTDLLAAEGRALPQGDLVDLGGIEGFRRIERSEDGIRIGAGVTWSEIVAADLPPAFDGLKAAAREVGGIQIQNAGTLAGNLCNASPAADGTPCLLTLDAAVQIAGPNGQRTLPVAEFVLGPRKVALHPGEVVTALLIPPQGAARSAFVKLGARRYLVISIAMVSAVITVADERVTAARIAVGACGPVARRLTALETDLEGASVADAADLVRPDHMAPLTPIDDIRADAGYRRAAALELVRRAVARAVA